MKWFQKTEPVKTVPSGDLVVVSILSSASAMTVGYDGEIWVGFEGFIGEEGVVAWGAWLISGGGATAPLRGGLVEERRGRRGSFISSRG